MEWKTLIAYITGTVDQELLVRNEYLVAENRILGNMMPGRVRLTNRERITLAEIGKRLAMPVMSILTSVEQDAYRQGPADARPCQYFDHQTLRPAQI